MEEKLEQNPSNCIKVVLFGPESTGKTSLAKSLAAYFNTEWVPEFSREYLQEKWNKEQKICEKTDILPIAAGQMELENSKTQKVDKILFSDTNLLETVVYSEAYYEGFCDPLLLKHALKAQYDLYFLMYIDVPWVADDLRDKPLERELMFRKFKNTLEKYKKPYKILKGGFQDRFETAVSEIELLLKARKLEFNSEDLAQIENRGIKPEEIARQLAIFKRGNIVVNIAEAATLKNGIISLSEEEQEECISLYETKQNSLDILKFVPASGAATRMFKALYLFLEEFNSETESVDDYVERKNNPKLELFFRRMYDFPFFEAVKNKIDSFEDLSEEEQQYQFVEKMLNNNGLGLGDYPKGLVPFHRYQDFSATAFEEHLREAADYATSNKTAKIHFTVAPEAEGKFREEFRNIKKRVEEETGVNFEIYYSFQDPKTDTIAATANNEPFRDEEGKLFFRPGGHGALLDNLNQQKADLIFIKNIDNVVIPKQRDLLAKYKNVLAGKLLQLQEKIFNYLKKLEKEDLSPEDLVEIIEFSKTKINTAINFDFEKASVAETVAMLKKKLNRPIRVCGMVKNEGEPGGGPFWVKQKTGEVSLQIVESSQIDYDNYQQSKIAQEATHFNPVDIVCAIKNYKGQNFNLQEFVDKDTSFIANKTMNGKELQALELPGLWNGGMADWISVFVEVPVETFNPVKTVADLLKPSHQVNRVG